MGKFLRPSFVLVHSSTIVHKTICLFASAVRSDISIRKKMNLENEIIAAVVVLYLFLSAVIVLVHYLQPEGQETKTSSPAHTEVQEGGNEIQTP
jgi:hypothetical protein